MRIHQEKFYLRPINYEKRFCTACEGTSNWQCFLQCYENVKWKDSQGREDLQKYKYLWPHFPTSFPAQRLTIYCVKLTRKDQGAVLSRRPWGRELPVPTPHKLGGTKENGLFHRLTTYQPKWLPQLMWSNHLVSALRIQFKEEIPPMEHEIPTTRASSHLLSWKLATEWCRQNDLGNPGSLWPTTFNVLGTSTSFHRANKSRNITSYSNFQTDLHL